MWENVLVYIDAENKDHKIVELLDEIHYVFIRPELGTLLPCYFIVRNQ